MTIESPSSSTEPTLLATWDYPGGLLLVLMQSESMRGDDVRPPRAIVRLLDQLTGEVIGQEEVLLPGPVTLGGMYRTAIVAAEGLQPDGESAPSAG